MLNIYLINQRFPKNKKSVKIKSTSRSKITIKVYKSPKYANKGKKAGLIKSYVIKASKNKKGIITLVFKKKLRANQALLVTLKKSKYKTVSKVKKVK